MNSVRKSSDGEDLLSSFAPHRSTVGAGRKEGREGGKEGREGGKEAKKKLKLGLSLV